MIVIWQVTEVCNLGCPFCAYDHDLRFSRRSADPAAILAFGAVLAELARTTGDPVLVSWLGGEPLIWPPLAALSRTFRHDLGLRLGVTTNGTTLGEEPVRTRLLEDYAELTVSVDGLEATHDQLRRWPGGFARLRRGLSVLAETKARTGRGPILRANVVLMRDNVGELEAVCRELAGWGVTEVTFNQLGGRDRPEFFADHRLLPEQTDALAVDLPGIRRRLAALGLRLQGGTGYLERIRASSRNLPLAVADCAPGRDFLFVDEQGRAAPCHFTVAKLGRSIASIASVDDLDRMVATFSEDRRKAPPPVCSDCMSTQIFEKFTGAEG